MSEGGGRGNEYRGWRPHFPPKGVFYMRELSTPKAALHSTVSLALRYFWAVVPMRFLKAFMKYETSA